MNIKQISLLFSIQILTLSLKAQKDITYYILGDNVNIRKDTLLTSKPLYSNDMGVTYLNPISKTKNWVCFYMELTNDTIYINSKYIGTKSEFFNKAKNKQNKNGATKYELLRIYLDNNDYTNAEPIAFDLMNNHKEGLVTHHETCDVLNINAFWELTKGVPNNINSKYPDKIIKTVKDSNIIALAHIVGIRYSILKREEDKGLKYIKDLIDIHLKHLLLDGCDYSTSSSTYPIILAKNNIFAYFVALTNGAYSSELIDFIRVHSDKEKGLKSEFCKDLKKVFYGEIWKEHFEYKDR